MKKQRFKKTSKKRVVIALLSILLAVITVVILEKAAITNFFGNKTANNSPSSDAQTTSDQPSAQPDFAEGDDREAGNTLREDKGSASIIDSAPFDSGSHEQNVAPITSSTGEISVLSPTNNLIVDNQFYIAGSSTLPSISYRIIDNISGVISTGELAVVNGKFSALVNINTGATEGRVDIFGIKPDGNEFSNIEIPLRFR